MKGDVVVAGVNVDACLFEDVYVGKCLVEEVSVDACLVVNECEKSWIDDVGAGVGATVVRALR